MQASQQHNLTYIKKDTDVAGNNAKYHGMKSVEYSHKQIFKFQFERSISMGSHKPPDFYFFSVHRRTETIKKKP